ncbi:MAG: HAD family hydrolase [Bacteroidota bacterium]
MKLVIFDLDGTFYSLSRLRSLVVRDLLLYYALRPHRWREIQYIRKFRSLREALADQAHQNLAQLQYQIAAEVCNTSSDRMQQVIEDWMIQRPIHHLKRLQYEEAKTILDILQKAGVQTAVFSDFPAEAKLRGMGLQADYILDATHPKIDQLKPQPNGLQYLLEKTGFEASVCLFVGDRDDRDGEAARRAGMPYWVLPSGERPLVPLLAELQKRLER